MNTGVTQRSADYSCVSSPFSGNSITDEEVARGACGKTVRDCLQSIPKLAWDAGRKRG